MSHDPFTPDHQTRFTMRIETELLNKIKDQAVKNKRSAAKEIEFILEKFFEDNHEE